MIVPDKTSPVASEEEVTLSTALVSTKAFQRLRSIRFLGAIDYIQVRVPNGNNLNVRHTRFTHSIKVADLATRYAAHVCLDPGSRLLACAAALLHDIGHAPLSHTLEPIFKEKFGIDHHKATKDLITGRVQIGREVTKILRDFRLDPEQVLAVLDGAEDPCSGFFSGPINFDTIEGILRTRQYATPAVSGPTKYRVLMAAIDRSNQDDRTAVDSFWEEKNEVYARIIRSREGVLADHLCQSIAQRYISRLSASDYLSTERGLFSRFPEMRDALRLGLEKGIEKYCIEPPSSYISRNFYVDQNHDFFSHDDRRRYVQNKSLRTFARPVAHRKACSNNVQLEMLNEAVL